MDNNLDFETFLNEINTEDNNDNDYYNRNGGDIEIFENFLDRIYDRIDNNNNPEDFYVFGDDDEIDNLLDIIEDNTEQNAGAIEAEL
jgi:hypothetical protein